MHVGAQQVAEHPVDHALPLDPAAAAEGLRDDQEAKVTFALGTRPGMADMARGFVDQLEPLRLQRGQACPDLVRYPHALPPSRVT